MDTNTNTDGETAGHAAPRYVPMANREGWWLMDLRNPLVVIGDGDGEHIGSRPFATRTAALAEAVTRTAVADRTAGPELAWIRETDHGYLAAMRVVDRYQIYLREPDGTWYVLTSAIGVAEAAVWVQFRQQATPAPDLIAMWLEMAVRSLPRVEDGGS